MNWEWVTSHWINAYRLLGEVEKSKDFELAYICLSIINELENAGGYYP